jgi:hypothetical protein
MKGSECCINSWKIAEGLRSKSMKGSIAMDDHGNLTIKLQGLLQKKENQITELLVVIDTAQRALARAESVITNNQDKQHVFNPSAKWVMKFKQ